MVEKAAKAAKAATCGGNIKHLRKLYSKIQNNGHSK
jgi:hypothetical protein